MIATRAVDEGEHCASFGRGRSTVPLLMAFTIASSGCFSPPQLSGLSCDARGECPDGLLCDEDNLCNPPRPDEDGDASSGDSGAPPLADGGAPPTSTQVTGLVVDRFVMDGLENLVPRTLDGARIEAVVPSKNGLFTTYLGSSSTDGSVSIRDVPEGEAYLRIGTTFFVTSSRNIDFGRDFLGRPQPVRTRAPTSIVVHLDNMVPWTTNSGLSFVVPMVAANTFALNGRLNPRPVAGATRVDGVFDYAQIANAYLLNGQDRAYVVQRDRVASLAGATVQVASASLVTPGLLVENAKTSTITGRFTAVAANRRLPAFRFNAAAWATLRTGANLRATTPGAITFDVRQNPYGDRHARFDVPTVSARLSVAETDVVFEGVDYGLAYPTSWPEHLLATHTASLDYQFPGATPRAIVMTSIVSARVEDLASMGAAPSISPPQDPKIDGVSFFSGGGPILSETPMLSWDLPAFGRPTAYAVYIYRIAPADGATTVTQLFVLRTTKRELLIPPGLLPRERSYAFRIMAIADPGSDPESAPERSTILQSHASAWSDVFTR